MRHEDFLEKSLPSNEEAEVVILGSIILYNEVGEKAFKILVPSDFYSPVHRRIYGAMLELSQLGQPIDPISITEIFKSHGEEIVAIGGTQTITSLTFGLPPSLNIEKEVALVKRHSIARGAVLLLNHMTSELLQGTEPVEDILDSGEGQLLNLTNRLHAGEEGIIDKGFFSLADITPALEKQFNDFHAGITNAAPTGMKELDEMLDGGGLQPGGVYLIAASEKTGKTSLALDWAYHGAVNLGLTVPIVTLEMSRENLAKRLYSAHTAIPYYRFRAGLHDSAMDATYTKAVSGLKDFAKYPIIIADRLFGLEEIARNLRRACEMALKVGKPIKYAIIDYLQLVEMTAGKNTTREQEVSGISRALKKLAAELGIALVIMSSLNRAGLSEGQEPAPHNLRDSGSLAFDAEALIFLHNPAFIPGKPYTPMPVTPMIMILARQRNGPSGRIPMMFIGEYMQFMTESTFRKNSQGNRDIPLSTGQVATAEQDTDLLWDTNEPKEKTWEKKSVRDYDDDEWDS